MCLAVLIVSNEWSPLLVVYLYIQVLSWHSCKTCTYPRARFSCKDGFSCTSGGALPNGSDPLVCSAVMTVV